MDGQFDLFEMKGGALPQWVGAAADLGQAMRRLENLAQAKTGTEYFVRDFCSGSVVAFAGHSDRRRISRVH
jgi:hypothetical protein